ncbi:hypothetical protein [Halorientalis litorea]|jgi:hypothetical protein|uniref:hypothetical protein n=1 Tax=Halorientalis litorea TaxID=2931977 RepID=UPI001FF16478|nr:hypothetical protein [Halorientalis litorea]
MDSEDSDDRRSGWFDVFVPAEVPVDTDTLDTLAAEFGTGLGGAMPDPRSIESALDGVSVPDAGTLDIEAAVRPDERLDHADAVVDAGADAVDVAIEGSGEAATVLVDTGGEVVEVAVENGGEAAAEATAELVVAALDGL